MIRPFIYARVSTEGQTTENQIQEIRGSNFEVVPHRIFEEVISGSVAARERPVFKKLLERLEPDDVLVVTKMDRLGRNAMDVREIVESLKERGVRVYCLALGGIDLTSPAGKVTMQLLAAVAEFEKDLLVERTKAGLARAKAQGKRLGRPVAVETTALVQQLKQQNLSQSEVAARAKLGLATVKRHWNKK